MTSLTPSVLVIGAGNFGAAKALSLLRKGNVKVTIVDAAAYPNPPAASHDTNKIVRDDYPVRLFMRLLKVMPLWALWGQGELYKTWYHEADMLRDDTTLFGKVEVPFSFSGESVKHLLDCCILPTLTRDLILCQSFLEATSTLTDPVRRITKSLRTVAARLQFNLLENDRRCLWGHLNGLSASALADTGCDVMLISTQFATKHSLKIDRSVEHRRTIQYADGSLDTTAGLIRDVAWQFGGSKERVKCDFYVLDNLTVDAVLSNHFLFELDVFTRFGNQMVDAGPMSDFQLSDLCIIRLISRYSRELEALESACITDSMPHSLYHYPTKSETADV
ncbi:hypothetical protein ACHAPJ_010504 [Fusarium lateritium]